MDLQAYGWEWAKRAHSDQLEFKTGKRGETALFELMLETANSPDERVSSGGFEDSIRRVSVGRVVLRTVDRDVQSFFPVAEVGGDRFQSGWKYRGASAIIGHKGLAHSAVGMFSRHPLHHSEPLISAFLPDFPRYGGKLKPFTDYNVAFELLPVHGVNMGTAKQGSPRELHPLEGEKREWFVRLRGTVTEVRPTYILLDCGAPVFIETKGFLNLTEGESLKAEGALYAYIEP
ncbi:MAG: hypothetical protein FJ149_03845 [Euryarchaeota archaeon]|nr:hypothetical protein [Euryarchaeota archaeon]